MIISPGMAANYGQFGRGDPFWGKSQLGGGAKNHTSLRRLPVLVNARSCADADTVSRRRHRNAVRYLRSDLRWWRAHQPENFNPAMKASTTAVGGSAPITVA